MPRASDCARSVYCNSKVFFHPNQGQFSVGIDVFSQHRRQQGQQQQQQKQQQNHKTRESRKGKERSVVEYLGRYYMYRRFFLSFILLCGGIVSAAYSSRFDEIKENLGLFPNRTTGQRIAPIVASRRVASRRWTMIENSHRSYVA